jgi:glyoxylase-like metal-dependent hydrolase (beta-lactamase superfamily II)
VRAVALHADVVLVTSAVLQVNCVIVRGRSAAEPEPDPEMPVRVIEPGAGGTPDECFVIDSPVLPDELDALPALLAQARFPPPSGLLATHGDWDHLLARLAYPELALGCAESTVRRLQAAPGEPQRDLRAFDEELIIERPRPLSLGSLQALPVPGRCEVGARELQLHLTEGHTGDGMAILAPWAGVLVCGDYLSAVEIPLIGSGGGATAYIATLERLRPLVSACEHVVPGHGAVLEPARALEILEEDLEYLRALADVSSEVPLPSSRRGAQQRRLHAANLEAR